MHVMDWSKNGLVKRLGGRKMGWLKDPPGPVPYFLTNKFFDHLSSPIPALPSSTLTTKLNLTRLIGFDTVGSNSLGSPF